MDDIYDVIIIGAGVSGLMLAKLLDGSAHRVLLLEKKSEVCVEPRTFGTFTQTALEHGLEDYIIKYFHTWAFYGPTVKAAQTSEKIMCLVDYQRWARSLKFESVVMKTGVDLQSAKWSDDKIILTERAGVYHGKLVVDASGCRQIVPTLLGLRTRKKSGLSYEVELDGCEIPVNDEASFIMDFRVSNSGGWIYALSRDKAQFGWADFWPESSSSLSDLKARVFAAMTRIGPQRDWFLNAKVSYSYGRFGPAGSVTHRLGGLDEFTRLCLLQNGQLRQVDEHELGEALGPLPLSETGVAARAATQPVTKQEHSFQALDVERKLA